jgi:mRNA-degrading endonuclease toxin of MazEF toxin-antitoxin module
MRLCAPIMGRKPEHGAFLWCLTVEPSDDNGLTKKSTVDASQTRALDLLRFEDKLGQMARDEVDLVAAALCSCVKS